MILLLLLVGVWMLSFPSVQNKLVPWAESQIGGALGTKVEIGEVGIDFPAKAVVKDVVMWDQHQPFLKLEEIKVSLISFSLLKFLFQPSADHHIGIGSVDLIRPEVHIYKSRRDSLSNLAFLSSDEPKDSTSSGRKIGLSLDELNLVEAKFWYSDSTKPDSRLEERNRLNYFLIRAENINGLFSFDLGLDKSMSGHINHLEAKDTYSGLSLDTLETSFHVSSRTIPADSGDSLTEMIVDLENTLIRTGGTRLSFDSHSEVSHPEQLFVPGGPKIADFNFRRSVFNFDLLNYFLSDEVPLNGVAGLSGPASWSMDKIHSDSIMMFIGEKTKLFAGLTLTDYAIQDELGIDVDFRNSSLNFEELYRLIPILDLPMSGTVGLDGRCRGDFSQLKSKNLKISYGKYTELITEFRLYNLTSSEDLLLDARMENSRFTFAEIQRLMPGIKFPKLNQQAGRIGLDGHFIGGVSDFVVDSRLSSALGLVEANLHLQLPPKVEDYTYEGVVRTRNFLFNKLGVSEAFDSEYLSFAGRIAGKGFELETMKASFDGRFVDSELFGYHVDTLRTQNLQIDMQRVFGGVELRDVNGDGNLYVDVDLGDDPAKIKLRGDVAELDLHHYGVSEDTILLSSVVNVDLQGDSVDNTMGKARFLLLQLDWPAKEKNINISDLTIRTYENTVNSKNIHLESSVADMDVSGNFSFKRGVDFFSRITREAKLYFQNNDSLIQDYYARKQVDSIPVKIDFEIRSNEQANALIDFMGFEYYLSPDANLSGGIFSNDYDQVNLAFDSDSLSLFEVEFGQTDLSLNLTKDGLANSLIAVGNLDIQEVNISEELSFSDVNFEPSLLDNQIEYWLRGSQPAYNNDFLFNATTTFSPGQVLTRINPKVSRIRTGESDWVINKNNFIINEGKKIRVSNLELKNEEQRIFVNGLITPEFSDTLYVGVENVPFSTIKDFYHTDLDIDGRVDSLMVKTMGLFTFPRAIISGNIDEFHYERIDSVDIGLYGWFEGNPRHTYFGIRTDWVYRNQKAFQLKGFYDFSRELSPIHFVVDSSQIPLRWVNSFTAPNVTDLDGIVRFDKFDIKGRLDSLQVSGEAHFEGEKPGQLASFHVDYLNKTFSLEDNSVIKFSKDEIEFPEIVVYDSDSISSKAVLNGTIQHSGFKDFRFFLDLTDVKDFVFMNTNKKDNESFYGRVVLGAGIASVTGNLEKIEINADVIAGAGSELSIPLTDYTSASRLNFVRFLSGKEGDTLNSENALSGFLLNMRVIVTPESRIRLIFDEQVGDIIEARGEGNLQMSISDEGEFEMFGTYEVEKGDYLFTAKNVVNKKFSVQQGSRISWNGDPYEAELDINAVYKVNAQLSDLLGGGTEVSASRVPVDIIMNMTGLLSAPKIALSLRLDNVTSDDLVGLESYFRNISYDEQELNRQVVSLLVFGRFASSAGSVSGSGGGVNLTSSISELVTNQVNYWLSQAFKANDVGVQLTTNEFEDIQLGLSAQLFGDKVTIERNGTIVGNQSGQMSIGNISVLIKLLPPQNQKEGQRKVNQGQLVLEIFNRESTGLRTANTNTTGVGVFFKKDFDNLKEFFGKKKKGQPIGEVEKAKKAAEKKKDQKKEEEEKEKDAAKPEEETEK